MSREIVSRIPRDADAVATHRSARGRDLPHRMADNSLDKHITEQDVTYSPGTIKDLVSAAHDAGLEVWVGGWGIAGIFGGEGLSTVGHLCPQSCQVQDVLTRWLDTVKASGADAAFLDEPRSSCCPIHDLVHNLVLEADVRGLRSAVCLSPDHPWAAASALEGLVTSVGTDPYDVFLTPFGLASYLKHWHDRLSEYAVQVQAEPHMWVRAFRLRHEQEEAITRSIKLLASLKVTRIGVWSYRPQRISVLSNERNDELWRGICRTIDELRQ